MNHLLKPLSDVYGWGVRQRESAFRRGWLKSRRLGRPVISVGNLSAGGSGKTPIVALIAEILLRYGYRPAILTRGYRRERGASLLALAPQQERSPDPRKTGDEPALLARKLPAVPILVCSDRYCAGRYAEKCFGADVHILDDGFQHFALARDLDLAAVDVTQELSDGALLPAGRLREPPTALARADMIVLTRVELQNPAPLERFVRSINPRAQIFHCSTALRALNKVGGNQTKPPETYRGVPLCAFCGIGNPQGFFSDLRGWGYTISSEAIFRDHHLYTEKDLEQLLKKARACSAVAMITTEKDVMNLPSKWKSEIPILACVTQADISDREAFEQAIFAKLQPQNKRQTVASAI